MHSNYRIVRQFVRDAEGVYLQTLPDAAQSQFTVTRGDRPGSVFVEGMVSDHHNYVVAQELVRRGYYVPCGGYTGTGGTYYVVVELNRGKVSDARQTR